MTVAPAFKPGRQQAIASVLSLLSFQSRQGRLKQLEDSRLNTRISMLRTTVQSSLTGLNNRNKKP